VLHPFADMQKLREAFESFDEKDEGYIPPTRRVRFSTTTTT